MTTAVADFPVHWDDPADADKTWLYDPVHIGAPMAPLEFDLGLRPFLEGFGWGMRPRLANYYVFFTMDGPRDAEPLKPGAKGAREGGRRWREQVLPEVLEHTQRYRMADFASMNNDQLIEEIDKLPALRHRSGQLHTMVIAPYWQGMGLLIETYKGLTGGDDLGAVRLVQGYPNKSFDSGEQLWQLSRVAASIPLVSERLSTIEKDTARDVLASLRNENVARPFIEAFDSYIEAYGWRSVAGLGAETWFENPTGALVLLKSQLQTKGYDPGEELRRLIDERETAVRETMASLDEDGRRKLQDVLDAACAVVNLSEDHNFYIDQRLWTMPRRLIMVAAERLASAGALEKAGDVFFLHHPELCGALRGDTGGLRETTKQRKEELKHWSAVQAPRFIGEAPAGGPPQDAPVRTEREGELSGLGASAGVARGPVRVIASLAEGDRLRPGDILVTKVTQPAWTPLFSIARAVVTEVGGVLTHTAIAAREYGIPAVVNLPDATRRLRDGQLVEVDGSAGLVRVIG